MEAAASKLRKTHSVPGFKDKSSPHLVSMAAQLVKSREVRFMYLRTSYTT